MNDKGIIVHGKTTLQYETDVPIEGVEKGFCVRFRQRIDADIALGEHTFSVGFSVIPHDVYVQMQHIALCEIQTEILRICHLQNIGTFSITMRNQGQTLQLTHYGIANINGDCVVDIVNHSE